MNPRQCALVVDAGAGLTETADGGLVVVPLRIMMGAVEFVDDGRAERYPEFYQLLRAGEMPSTSTPSPGDYLTAFRRTQPLPVVCLTIPARWSGMYATAVLAADMLAQEEGRHRVTVMETPTAAIGFALVCRFAASLCDSGLPAEEVVQRVRQACADVCMYGVLSTLTYVARSGRINSLLAGISNSLHVRPVFRVIGDDTGRVALTRTSDGALKALEKVAAEQLNGEPQWLLVFHADSPAEAATLCERLTSVATVARSELVPLAPISGAYTGPGAIGFAAIPLRDTLAV